tara:strand:- start:1414 stop:1680 length:267 start_codon:yes stop_codon:yes gene_type:complete
MKKVTFKLIVECESDSTTEELLKEYLEKYLINQHNLEAVKLRIIADDDIKSMGFGLHSVKLEKEKKEKPTNDSKKTTKRKPVSKTSKS